MTTPPAAPSLRVFVRGLVVMAEIGLYDHERGRTQPLVVDIEAGLGAPQADGLGSTLDYNRLARAAEALARGGHIDLVEDYAQSLADACVRERHVVWVRVRVEKTAAIAAAAAAGVEVVRLR